MNLPKLCTDPRKDLRCFNVVGVGIVQIAAVLISRGDIPVCVNL